MDEKIKKLIEENMKLVPTVVWHKFKGDISRNPELLDEYISIGNLALTKAASKFDESLGYAFSTYACSVIWGEIQKFRRDNKSIIKFPRRLHEAGAIYNQGKALNKDINTICKETGVKKEDIEEWLNVNSIVSLDAPLQNSKNEEESLTKLDTLADNIDIEKSIIEDIAYKEKMKLLEKILKPREFQIVKLVESGIYKQTEIAKKIKLSQPQVGRILKKLTEKVGPTLEMYYSGEITLQEFCKKLGIEEDKLMKFDKEVDIACKWLIDSPGEELNLGQVLKMHQMDTSTHYRTKIKNKVLKKMLAMGYDVKEVPYAARGTRLVLNNPRPVQLENTNIIEDEKSIKPVANVKENILLNILDIPISDCDLKFTEALQQSLSMFTMLGKTAVLDIVVREVGGE